MARNDIVPIAELSRRTAEAGRIRLGKREATSGGKTRPAKLSTFRFTSPHRDLIERLAAKYGGTARPWNEPSARIKNQFEVISTVNQIEIYLPQNGLSQQYELWAAGGRSRACDGYQVETVRMEGESSVPSMSPCICAAKGQRECQPITRINLVLPDMPFLGLWRIESKGWAALHELPGMFELLAALQPTALLTCVLGVEERTDKVGGKTRNYVVPTLGSLNTALEIQQGAATVAAIGTGTAGAIASKSATMQPEPLALQERNGHSSDADDHPDDVPGDDDDIAEGEIVDPAEDTERRRQMHDDMLAVHAVKAGLDEAKFIAAVRAMPKPVDEVLVDLAEGIVRPVKINPTGTIKWATAATDG